MARTDDELVRSMVKVSGDVASIYRGRVPASQSPIFVALQWWLSLEDLSDPGNRATLDYLTCSTGWDDYADAEEAFGESAICMTAIYDETNKNCAFVRFVPACIDLDATVGVVPPDSSRYLSLVNVHRSTARRDDGERWMVWGLAREFAGLPSGYRPAW